MKHLIDVLTKAFAVAFISLALAACTVEDPNRVAPPNEPVAPHQEKIHVTRVIQEWGTYPTLPEVPDPKKPDAVTVTSEGLQTEFHPQVDILFVIDNSQSMSDDQVRLVANMNRFVEAFSENKLVDYHVGVVSVWDSHHFLGEGESAGDHPEKNQKDLKIGQLRPVKSLSANFVSSETNDKVEVLKEALNIGVEPLSQGGPEFEELFSVVEAAIGERNQNENKGFIRGSDSQLVVILITDADDSSPNTNASKVADKLWSLKKGDRSKISTYGVLSLGRDCEKDPMLKADRSDPSILLRFLDTTKDELHPNNSFSLCDDNYGQKLSDIGKDIVRKTLTKEIQISGMRFEIDKKELAKCMSKNSDKNSGSACIDVRYGSQSIPMDPDFGWTYNPLRNSFIINGQVKLKPEPDAKISITATPLVYRKQ